MKIVVWMIREWWKENNFFVELKNWITNKSP